MMNGVASWLERPSNTYKDIQHCMRLQGATPVAKAYLNMTELARRLR
jgi:hypothetical protein